MYIYIYKRVGVLNHGHWHTMRICYHNTITCSGIAVIILGNPLLSWQHLPGRRSPGLADTLRTLGSVNFK